MGNKHNNPNIIENDIESLEMIKGIKKMIMLGFKKNIIPKEYKQQNIIRFNNIELALLEEHDKEFSEKVYNELRQWLINFDRAFNKSKV